MEINIPNEYKGVVLLGSKQCEVREYQIPSPGIGEVLIQIRASSLCGSDLRAIYRPAVHKTDAEGYLGVIAGHEPAGVIVKVGGAVSSEWRVGTRVVVYHISGCGACTNCRRGLYITCSSTTDRKAYGWQRDGGHGEYMIASQQSLLRLPEPLTYLDGAIVACGLGTVYAAALRAQISGRDRVLVTGLGPVGLGMALLAQRLGAKSVIGLEFDPDRLAFAKKLGIRGVLCSQTPETSPQQRSEEDLRNVVQGAEVEEVGGFDVAIDCSASASARLLCLKAAREWGRVVFVGEGGSVSFEVSPLLIHKNLTLSGSWVCSVGQMEELLELLRLWKFHPECTISHTFSIEDAARAYELFDTGKTGKCAIVYQGEKQKYLTP